MKIYLLIKHVFGQPKAVLGAYETHDMANAEGYRLANEHRDRTFIAPQTATGFTVEPVEYFTDHDNHTSRE